MTQFVHPTALLISMTMLTPFCKAQVTTVKKPVIHRAKGAEKWVAGSLIPLDSGTEKQILAYYRKRTTAVEKKFIDLDNKKLLCLSLDTGLGRTLLWGLIYIRHDARYVLLHSTYAKGNCVHLEFLRDGKNAVSVVGAFVTTSKSGQKVYYKAVDTVKLRADIPHAVLASRRAVNVRGL